MSWTKERFLDLVAKAHQSERQFVAGLRDRGIAAAHGKKLVLPDHNPKKDFCPTLDALAMVSLEIKVRKLSFTGPEDFPYDTVFLDDESGLSKGPCPFAWVLISKPTGAWVWASALDRSDDWKFQTVWDSLRGFQIRALVAPASCLRPPEQLLSLLLQQDQLQWVEGEIGAFTDEECRVSKSDPAARGRGRKTKKSAS
jgi:hypothetical protein